MCHDALNMYTCGHSKLKARHCDNLDVPHIICVTLYPKGPPIVVSYFNYACRKCTALEIEYSLARDTLPPLPAPVVEESIVEFMECDDAASFAVASDQLDASALEGQRALKLNMDNVMLNLTPKEPRGRRSTLEDLRKAEILEMLRPGITRDRRCTLLFLPNEEVLVKVTPESSNVSKIDAPGLGGVTTYTPPEKYARQTMGREDAQQGMVLPSVMTKEISRKPVPQRSAGAGRGRTHQPPHKPLRRTEPKVTLSEDKILKKSKGTTDPRKKQSPGCSNTTTHKVAKGTKQNPGDRALLPSYRYASNNGVPPAGAEIPGQASNNVQRSTTSQTQSEQAPSKQARRHHSDSAVHRSRKELHSADIPARSASLGARRLRKRNGVYFGNPKPAGNTSDYNRLLELGNTPTTKNFTAVHPDSAGLSSPRRGAVPGACPEPRTYTAWKGP